jgi:hypothetical protein
MIEWEIEELACKVLGKSDEEMDQIINNSEIDDLLFNKYEICFEQYCSIVKDLIPFTSIVKTELTETLCQGFVDNKNKCFIVKIKL